MSMYAHRSLVHTSKLLLLKSLFSSQLLFDFIGNNNQENYLLSWSPDKVVLDRTENLLNRDTKQSGVKNMQHYETDFSILS